MIVGVTGTMGAGKTSVVEALEKQGFKSIILSDIIREEAKKKGVSPERANLREIGDQMRKRSGMAVLAEKALEKAEKWESDLAIGSVRLPQEAEAIKAAGGRMIGVTAPDKLRYKRTRERKREDKEAKMSFEDFKKTDRFDRSLGIDQVLEDADYLISNDGSLKDLEVRVKQVISDLSK